MAENPFEEKSLRRNDAHKRSTIDTVDLSVINDLLLMAETPPKGERNLLHEVADNMIQDMFMFIDQDDKHKPHMPPAVYAYQFATIKLGSYRGRGHTEAIKMLAYEYTDCCVVVPDMQMVRNSYRDIPFDTTIINAGGGDGHLQHKLCSVAAGRRDNNFSLCLIDNDNMLSHKQLDYLYGILAPVTEIFVRFQ